MYVKIMGPEDCPDDDTRKTYRLVQQVVSVEFSRVDGEPAILHMIYEDHTTDRTVLVGNVYVMNDQGKTIDRFGVASVPGTKRQSMPPARFGADLAPTVLAPAPDHTPTG